jgi:hypothetical protein
MGVNDPRQGLGLRDAWARESVLETRRHVLRKTKVDERWQRSAAGLRDARVQKTSAY